MNLSSYHICVEGTIGVGKTSLVNLLADRLEARTVLEKFEDNPFLSDFYRDRDRYAMQTQLFFLLSRYKQQQDLQQIDMFTKSIILLLSRTNYNSYGKKNDLFGSEILI